jgi:hypothetical protein
MELIYNKRDTPTFIHHTGVNTNPDLLIVSSDIAEYTHRKIIEDPGSGHRAVIATIKSKNHCPERNTRHAWNFKKENWKECTTWLENKLPDITITNVTSPNLKHMQNCS